jgi:hypothetical protein
MQGEKLSSFIPVSASQLFNTDLLYLINNNNSTKITLPETIDWLNSNGIVGMMNGRYGNVALSAIDFNLDLLTNKYPVTSLSSSGTTLIGNANISAAAGLSIKTTIGSTKTVTVGVKDMFIPWSSLIDSIYKQGDLSGRLASVGIQNPPRYITQAVDVFHQPSSSGGMVDFIVEDFSNRWVEIWVAGDVEINIPYNLAPYDSYAGLVLEVRQGLSNGTVAINTDSSLVSISNPYGTIYDKTNAFGQRIQIVCVGANSWEYR